MASASYFSKLWSSRRRRSLSRKAVKGNPSRGGLFARSFLLRHLDSGSCNACELELIALSGPHYDTARFGIDFVASPRHADGVVITGPVTRNLAEAVVETAEAVPCPRLVIACGDCACGSGPFRGGYATLGGAEAVVEVDCMISGCPPTPEKIIESLDSLRKSKC